MQDNNTTEVSPGEPVRGLSAPAPSGVYSIADLRPNPATPPSNTGSPHTTQTLLDWLSFSFPKDTEVAKVLTFMSPEGSKGQVTTDQPSDPTDGWVALERGAMGYKACYARGHIKVFHDGTPEMGVHVAMSGKGCRQLEAERSWSDESDWRSFLRSAIAKGCKVTRLDVAMDDRGDEGVLSMETIRQAVEKDEVTSLFRVFNENTARRLGRPRKDEQVDPNQGHTMYFGDRRNSLMFVRIYDKAKEQLLPPDVHWIRVEMCARGINAHSLTQNFCDLGSGVFPTLLNGYLTFREPSETDTNPSRWPVAAWWEAFLGTIEKSRLSLPAVVRTVEKAREWLIHQVAPTLALIVAADQEIESIIRIAELGALRLSAVHQAMLRVFWCANPTNFVDTKCEVGSLLNCS